ncbi:hypothetical protein [Selenomonas sp. oral taxon 149]|uniref:hypothetical protein n=1 Tax=Selenomonas sp. oral taxon 149 TaxID=712535 RepID=UPI0001E0A7C8|nr:hypothetical protein [Selenomonas sp. oral taxon 149]EFM22832.1 hypothetical protein HMPREF9166_1557 [Selenomonas sp. oral taxon 149 str. 67H29BP]
MQSITCLLAAGILLLPVSGTAAEKETEIHAVMAAEESHGDAAASEQRTASAAKDAQETVDTEKTTDRAQTTAEPAAKDRAASEQRTQEDAFDAEMDELGTENPPAEQTPQTNAASARDAEAKTKTKTAEETADGEGTAEAVLVKEPVKEKEPAAAATDGAGHSAVSAEPAKKADAADKKAEKKHAAAAAAKREAYGKETAIEPVTLKDGDWVFIEGDERRGWFFDRSHMKRNADGSVSYWQLILYNNLGRAQFAEAMKNADYEHLGYTMQRRVLSPKKDAISTYEILAYDGNSALITESSREGHRAVIRANTMTEKERDAVRQELRRKK